VKKRSPTRVIPYRESTPPQNDRASPLTTKKKGKGAKNNTLSIRQLIAAKPFCCTKKKKRGGRGVQENTNTSELTQLAMWASQKKKDAGERGILRGRKRDLRALTANDLVSAMGIIERTIVGEIKQSETSMNAAYLTFYLAHKTSILLWRGKKKLQIRISGREGGGV